MKNLPNKTFPINEDGFVHLLPVVVIALLVLIGTAAAVSLNQPQRLSNNTAKSYISKITIGNENSSVLGESESGSGSSGSGSSGSGSSGSGSSDSGSSGSNDGDRDDDRSGSGSSGSGSSGSGSSGSGSSGSGSSPRPTSTSGNRVSTPKPTSSPRLSPSPSPFRIDQDIREASGGGRTRVQVDEGQTRLEQEIIENGIRKRIEMRNENGRIRIRVKVKDLATGVESEQRFEQRPDEGRVTLKVTENGLEKEVKIRATNERFVIEQAGFGGTEASASATTNFPLTVDAENNTIAITTPLGVVNVTQLPATAIENILAANVLDKVESTELTEPESEQDKNDPNKQVVYRIKGVKETKFLGLIKVDAPILVEVSAITSQTTLIEQPWFLNAFGFLFTK